MGSEVPEMIDDRRGRVHRRALVAVLLALGLLAGCGGDPEPEATPQHLSGPVAAMIAWQQEAFVAGSDAPEALAVRRYFTLRQDLRIPERRPAAEDTLWSLLTDAPDNFLWLEMGLLRRRYLAEPARLDSMLAATLARDPGGPVAEFIRARRDWSRVKDATEGFFRAEARQQELDALQRLWLAARLALVETKRGEHEQALERLLQTLPTAWEVGGLPLAACWWRDVSHVTLRLDWLDDSLAAARLAIDCAQRDGDEIQEIRGRLAASAAHLARAGGVQPGLGRGHGGAAARHRGRPPAVPAGPLAPVREDPRRLRGDRRAGPRPVTSTSTRWPWPWRTRPRPSAARWGCPFSTVTSARSTPRTAGWIGRPSWRPPEARAASLPGSPCCAGARS